MRDVTSWCRCRAWTVGKSGTSGYSNRAGTAERGGCAGTKRRLENVMRGTVRRFFRSRPARMKPARSKWRKSVRCRWCVTARTITRRRSLHWRPAGIHLDQCCAGACLRHSALSVEEAAQPSRVFLPLRQPRNGGAYVRLRGVFGGYGNSPLWDSYLPPALPSSRSLTTRGSDLQPRGLDMAFGGHVPADPRLDPGGWISFLALGLLQRVDDDVSAGHGIIGPSPEAGNLERMEAFDV